jgi:hypothetical protein
VLTQSLLVNLDGCLAVKVHAGADLRTALFPFLPGLVLGPTGMVQLDLISGRAPIPQLGVAVTRNTTVAPGKDFGMMHSMIVHKLQKKPADAFFDRFQGSQSCECKASSCKFVAQQHSRSHQPTGTAQL